MGYGLRGLVAVPDFVFDCPRCGRPTRMGPDGSCLNSVTSGICGFTLPTESSGSQSLFRKKVLKHTGPPTPGSTAVHSCVASPAEYATYQRFVMGSGSLYHDPVTGRLFLWDEPQGGAPIAEVHYPLSGTVLDAAGAMMPLNSRPQDLHHWYANYDPRFNLIASGPGLTIEMWNSTRKELRVYQSGNLVWSDLVAS